MSALILTGGVIEVGSFGTLTLGFMVAESSGFALMADGWARATHESLDMKLPPSNQGMHKVKEGKQRDGTPESNGMLNLKMLLKK
ncbi:MAG TPA: hypothetical protein DCE71_00455 [Parachlamydiales bacterium]|nr:hypothetical protein [Parachlamydiales bacterium]